MLNIHQYYQNTIYFIVRMVPILLANARIIYEQTAIYTTLSCQFHIHLEASATVLCLMIV